LNTYIYTTPEGLDLECKFDVEAREPADQVNGIPEYPMSVSVYTISVNGADIYDLLSNYTIISIEDQILQDLGQ
jgi:hypothetical protein